MERAVRRAAQLLPGLAEASQADSDGPSDAARAAATTPGSAGPTIVRDAATPVTYERYTGNRCGSSVGWSWNPAHAPAVPPKGMVPGLVFVGHWSFRLGGIPSALLTGFMVGQRL